MRHRGKLTFGGLLLAVLAVFFAPDLLRETGAPSAPSAPGATSAIAFHSEAALAEHYRKHGAEFGSPTQAEYLRRAQELRDRPKGGDVLEIVRADGVITRFDKSSGAFLAFNRDRTIRTLFKPDDGLRYFERQAGREDH